MRLASMCGRLAVDDGDGRHLKGSDGDRFIGGKHRHIKVRDPEGGPIDHIREALFDGPLHRLTGVDGQVTVVAEDAQVIDAVEVVGVVVGIEHRVEMLQAAAECLEAELRPAVDEEGEIILGQQDTRAVAPIPFIL